MRVGPSCQPRAIGMRRRSIMEEARKAAQLHTGLPCLCHPGLDPGSRSATSKSGTPDQVRGDAGREAGREGKGRKTAQLHSEIAFPFQGSGGGVLPRNCAWKGREGGAWTARSEEHTSELQSLMRISYAVFCLKKKKIQSKLRTSQNH